MVVVYNCCYHHPKAIYFLLALLATVELFSYLWFIYLDDNETMVLFDWLAPITKLLTCLYLAKLAILHRRHAVYSSGPVFFFNFFFLLYHVATVRTLALSIFDNVGIWLHVREKIHN